MRNARADDAFRLQALDRLGEIRAGARDMHAVGAETRRQAGRHSRSAARNRRDGRAQQRRHDRFGVGLRAGREAHERAGDRRGVENLGEKRGEGGGVGAPTGAE